MKQVITFFILLGLLMLAPCVVENVLAQAPPSDPEPIPIDGGLSVLIAAGVAYGAKRLYKKNKVEETENKV